jgi:hypothetical protein
MHFNRYSGVFRTPKSIPMVCGMLPGPTHTMGRHRNLHVVGPCASPGYHIPYPEVQGVCHG